jgi:hypothetical protein
MLKFLLLVYIFSEFNFQTQSGFIIMELAKKKIFGAIAQKKDILVTLINIRRKSYGKIF